MKNLFSTKTFGVKNPVESSKFGFIHGPSVRAMCIVRIWSDLNHIVQHSFPEQKFKEEHTIYNYLSTSVESIPFHLKTLLFWANTN